MPRLGSLKKVPLRSIWKHEAIDFTQWLAQEDNLSTLGEEVGIEILNPKTEVGVGSFAVDIVAIDADEKPLIIENQLTKTDHDHLGKIITYASGLEASTVIWIVAQAREEHKQAVQWLNDNTSTDINIFLIEVEAWCIDNSMPAPKFNAIVRPNDWTKILRQTGKSQELSETKLKQQEFWEKVKEYGEESSKKVKSWQKPRPQHWYTIRIGTSDAHLVGTVNSVKNSIGMELYIKENMNLYHKLYSKKDEIEGRLGYKLDWQDLPEKKGARIQVVRAGDFMSEEQLLELAQWISDKADEFINVFQRYL